MLHVYQRHIHPDAYRQHHMTRHEDRPLLHLWFGFAPQYDQDHFAHRIHRECQFLQVSLHIRELGPSVGLALAPMIRKTPGKGDLWVVARDHPLEHHQGQQWRLGW